MKKSVQQFITIFIFSFLFGIFGLFFGISIGGELDFPLLWGMRGYESGGVFFALIGITLGGLAGFLVIAKKFNERPSVITLLLIITMSFLINFFIWYIPDMAVLKLILVLIMPSLLIGFVSHYKFLSFKR